MKFQKRVLMLIMLVSGSVVMPHYGYAQVKAEHQHMNMDEHHHHHAPLTEGYTRVVASYQTPDVKMVDANDKEVSLRDSLDGSGPVMLNFIFTTCTTICPVMSSTFSEVQAKLGGKRNKIRIISISIDPEHDTPSKLNAYAKRFDAGAQWSFLTGTIENSIAVQRAFDIYRGDKMNHEPVIFMRKGADQPWVRINGFIAADDLLREYDQLTNKKNN